MIIFNHQLFMIDSYGCSNGNPQYYFRDLHREQFHNLGGHTILTSMDIDELRTLAVLERNNSLLDIPGNVEKMFHLILMGNFDTRR